MPGDRNASYLAGGVGYGYFQRDQISAEASVKTQPDRSALF